MFPRTALVIAGWFVLSLAVAFYALPAWFFRPMRAQMAAGRVYMDSLTEKDVPVWIDRTEKLLSKHPDTVSVGIYQSGSPTNPIPSDLSELKIRRIDISENGVSYVWMGGLDHTELQIHRLEDGSFQFVAQYNDAKSKVIWPKE